MSLENTGSPDQPVGSGEEERRALLNDLAARAGAEAREAGRLWHSSLVALGGELELAALAIAQHLGAGACVYTFGHGESSIDAACGAALVNRSRCASAPARSLVADRAGMTAPGEDAGELSFSRQLAAFARAGDIAIGYSTDPEADPVIGAFEEAGRRGLLTVGFSGCAGGQTATRDVLDHCFAVSSRNPHRIREAVMALSYELWARVEQLRARDGRYRAFGSQQTAADQEPLAAEEAR
jgi:D-sedoheptulose 7-phosphate isomerase